MILLAESGSTKTNWLDEKQNLVETIGFNPLFHTSDSIYDELLKQEVLVNARDNYDRVYFYGAACSSPERKAIVEVALKRYFAKATEIKVDHDMMAAALAT